jgi:hypothetical protein
MSESSDLSHVDDQKVFNVIEMLEDKVRECWGLGDLSIVFRPVEKYVRLEVRLRAVNGGLKCIDRLVGRKEAETSKIDVLALAAETICRELELERNRLRGLTPPDPCGLPT